MSLTDSDVDSLKAPSRSSAKAHSGGEDDCKVDHLNGDFAQHEASIEYLEELLKDKKNLELVGRKVFNHAEELLEAEISRVRHRLLFSTNRLLGQSMSDLPEPKGNKVSISDKVYVPVSLNPQCNFIGRILGPRGITAKELEHSLGCKLMIRGRGSMKEKIREQQLRGQPNFEHLDDELHVLIQVDDTENRAEAKLKRAKETIEQFLVATAQTPEGADELKRIQLMELAVLNCDAHDDDPFLAALRSMPQMGATTTAPCILSALPVLPTFAQAYPALLNATLSLGNLSQIPVSAFPPAPLSSVNAPPTPPISIQASSSQSTMPFHPQLTFSPAAGMRFTYPSASGAHFTSAMHTPPADNHHLHMHNTVSQTQTLSLQNCLAAQTVPNATAYQQLHHSAPTFYSTPHYGIGPMQSTSVYP